jgi:predicted RND superfamily exporter protein
MSAESSSTLQAVFRFVVAKRWWVIGCYALLLGPAIFYALRVDQDNSLDRLIVQSDPDFVATRAFGKVFAQGEYALIFAEAGDPYALPVLQRFDAMERALSRLPRVNANSALSIFRRTRAVAELDAARAREFRSFATGTDLFRKQGIVGDRFLAIPLLLDVHNGKERTAAIEAINRVIAPIEKDPAPFASLRKVGQPYVNVYLDSDTRSVGLRYFPLFGLFVVVLIIALYRSFRALVAFIVALGMSAALTVGFVGVTGGVFTIVSALVPMTVLITCTATLVYVHSRFVDQPPKRSVADHQIFALANKFLACTASLFAAAVGFAALAVSKIRPIREMGISVAIGMVFIWLVVFTLFPALQAALRTPTQRERKVAGQWFVRFTEWLPLFTYRYRWLLVVGALALSGVGVVALFGIPGQLKPMHLQTNAIEYINPDSDLYRYTKRFEKLTAGLAITEVWLKGKLGSVSQPEVVRGLNRFQRALEQDRDVGAVTGLPTILSMLRYVAGKGDRLPDDLEELEKITDTLEAWLPREPMLQGFVEKTNLSQTHIMVITKTVDYEGFQALDQLIKRRWRETALREPALKDFELRTVGLAPLTAKISFHLVPTLVESFGLTVAIILGTFILIFRSGAARLMAMIPSLFAILVMFLAMRVLGMSLNVATIIIASTVLGVTENDQIHFFYHFLEKKRAGLAVSTEEQLRHTLAVAGRAIFFATLINAGGFLAFALAELPPIRQFGILSSLAFVLSMLADFTALPAALWIIFRDKPDALKAAAPPAG